MKIACFVSLHPIKRSDSTVMLFCVYVAEDEVVDFEEINTYNIIYLVSVESLSTLASLCTCKQVNILRLAAWGLISF